MSRLLESDEGPPWFTYVKFIVIKIRGCEKSLTTVTENCQIEGNLGYSDSFWLSQYLYYNWVGLYLTKYGKFELSAT